MNATDLSYTPALELARLYREKTVSPVEVTEAVLARIERLNPKLNAYLTVTADHARELARAAEARLVRGQPLGRLDGIPYSIKDLEPTAGIRTTFGSKFFEQNVPTEDGAVASRLRGSGGVLLGKTNTPHFGYKDMCDNLIGPPCKNPWNLARTSGASSGGAGSAVAAGLGPLAHGSDGSGSIRIPSALCGIFGLKPSLARVPYWPSADLWGARSHNGPMTRTVRDAAILLQVLAGPDARDPLSIDAPPEDYLAACEGDVRGWRVGWSVDLGYAAVDPEVAELDRARGPPVRGAGRACRGGEGGLGPPLRVPQDHLLGERGGTELRPCPGAPGLDRADAHAHDPRRRPVGVGRLPEGAPGADRVLREGAQDVRPLRAPADAADAGRRLAAEPGPFEGLPELGGKPAHSMFDRVPFTYPFNLTGYPAANVPCGFTREKLPVGLQIVGRWHREVDVLRAAACFEAIQPWAPHRPPLD